MGCKFSEPTYRHAVYAVGPNGLDYACVKVTLVNQDVPAAIYVQGLASRIARVRTTEKTYGLGKFLWCALTRVECPLMAQVSAKITADRHNEDRECIIPGIVCAGHCPWASAQGPRGSLRELNFLSRYCSLIYIWPCVDCGWYRPSDSTRKTRFIRAR